MKIKKEWLYRAVRTFLQAAVAYAAVVVPNIDFSNTSTLTATFIGLGTSAVAAGVSAVMNADWNHID